MEFLQGSFLPFLERRGGTRKRKKKDCGDAASIEKETKKVRNRGKRKKRSALIYFFVFLSFLLLFFLLFFYWHTSNRRILVRIRFDRSNVTRVFRHQVYSRLTDMDRQTDLKYARYPVVKQVKWHDDMMRESLYSHLRSLYHVSEL